MHLQDTAVERMACVDLVGLLTGSIARVSFGVDSVIEVASRLASCARASSIPRFLGYPGRSASGRSSQAQRDARRATRGAEHGDLVRRLTHHAGARARPVAHLHTVHPRSIRQAGAELKRQGRP